MNFNKFCSTFVGHFALLDPDPDSEYGSGSTSPIKHGSNPDPHPGYLSSLQCWIRIGSGSVSSQQCWIRIGPRSVFCTVHAL